MRDQEQLDEYVNCTLSVLDYDTDELIGYEFDQRISGHDRESVEFLELARSGFTTTEIFSAIGAELRRRLRHGR